MINVLSVGAGAEQLLSILEAKKLGFRVIAIDGNPDSEGFAISDIKYAVDIKDKEKVIQISKENNIQGIVPSPIGRYLTTLGAVNDALNLKGISEQSAIHCTDKYIFNQLLAKHGFNCANQKKAKKFEDIKQSIESIGLPCILKPRFGSGSRGVIVIEKEADIDFTIKKHMMECTLDEDSIIEGMLQGKEYGIDGVVVGNKFKLILTREKILTDLPYRQEIGYMGPAIISEGLVKKIQNYLQDICRVLELNNCLIQADILIDGNDISVIEIAGRPSGLNISSIMVPETTGMNVLENGIKLSLDLDYDFTVEQKNPLVLMFLMVPTGEVIRVPQEEEIMNRENVCYYESKINPGDIMTDITCGHDLSSRGLIVTKGNSIEEALEEAETIINMFGVK